MHTAFPHMLAVRQRFPETPELHVRAETRSQLQQVLPGLRRGQRIAIGVGSRGIAHLQEIVAETVTVLRGAGCEPFIVPAMGSHGGATPEGQTQLLADYGISESALGVPVRAGMEARAIGTTEQGLPVWFSEVSTTTRMPRLAAAWVRRSKSALLPKPGSMRW